MAFCGSKSDAMSVKDGVLQNECFVDVLNIIPHATLSLIGIFIVTVWNHSVMGKLKAKTWVHFQGHNFRWILTIMLLIVLIIEIAEGFISDSNDADTTNYHAFIPQCLAFLGALVGIIYYHKVEIWNSPKFLLAMLIYWPAAISLKFLKVFSMYKNNISWLHLKMWMAWAVIGLYVALLVVELNLLRLQKYAFFSRSCRLKAPKDLEKTRYIQSYVNLLSKALYWWITDILVLGYKRPLTLSDLGELPKSERAIKHYKKMQMIFEAEKAKAAQQNGKPSLTKSYLKAFWKLLLLAGLYRFLGDMLAFVGPICIEHIVNYAYDVKNHESFANSNSSSKRNPVVTVDQFFWNGYTLSVLLFLAAVLQNTFLQNHHFLVIREGVRLRSAIQAMVYSKSLKLSSLVLSNGKLTTGQIMNNMSVDSTFLMYFFFFIHYIWAVPVQVSITLTILYWKLGISAVIGGLFVVVCAPVMYFLGVCMSKMQKKVLVHSDKRVKKVNEVIQGIKVVKLLAWEDAFVQSVEHTRDEEIRFLIPHSCFKGLMGVIGMAAPVLGAMMTFVLHPMLNSQPLTAGVALTILALFNLLSGPLQLLSLVSAAVANATVSGRRLMPLLLAEEVSRHPSASMANRRFTTIVVPEPASEKSTGLMEDKFDTVVSVDAENSSPETVPLRPNAHHGDNDSCCSSSIISFSSGGATGRSHSRQNSGDSLLDVFELKAGSLHRNATSSELLDVKPLMLMRKSSAPVLSSSEGHGEYKRRRHHSGVSTGDLDDDVHDDLALMEPSNVIEIFSGNFTWDLETRELTLKDINVKVPGGKLTMVVGQVGMGKSSLLAAMLGEMVKVSGFVEWASDVKVAYVSQTPWLLNASLRDNILFGSPYVWRKYKKVIAACALQPDLEQLPNADLTEIGEKGVNLSGGQKQRVAIARALYSGADTVVMDDPLSALDSHTGRHILEEAILKRLVKRKRTVVLVTHHVQYLPHASQVVVMVDGKVYYQGKVGDVKKFDPDLYESWRKAIRDARASEHKGEAGDHLAVERKHSSSSGIGYDPLIRPASVQSQLSVPGVVINSRKMSQMSHMSVMTEASNEEQAEEEGEEEKENTETAEEKGRMIKQEHKETGAVALSVYLRYFKACSATLCIVSIVFQFVYHGILVSSNYWLTLWSGASDAAARNHSSQRVGGGGGGGGGGVRAYNSAGNGNGNGNVSSLLVTSNVTVPNSNQGASFDGSRFLTTYVCLSSTSVVAAFFATFIVLISGTYGGKVLYVNMLRNVMHLPMRFFDTNPSGRILNRFSADITSIDQKLASYLENLLRCILYCLSAVILNTVVTPWYVLAALPLAVIYYLLQRFFRSSCRELQRLDSVTKSPIFSHFSETLSGLQTIRAFRAEREFWRRAMQAIDTNVTPFIFLHTANRWLGVRLDYMSCMLVFASAIASLSAGVSGNIDPAFIGLCISYSLMVSGHLNWIVRVSTEVEMAMNAVERVLEYTDTPTEPSTGEKEECKDMHDESWPPKGKVVFRHVSLTYDEGLDPVLSNASFVINPGEKVGVCGRTGSGKSSTVLALFRVLTISDGEILIDDTNISHVPLHHLRSRLAIIPQDPILFSGTLRFNLDPDHRWSDDRLWQALESVQMKSVVQALPEKLDAEVNENGSNFSLGQRQLLCMARALVRNSRIIILDEATASIDHETETAVQDIVCGADFQGRTVITIAHRISTIKQYDRVMVLDNGFLLEFAPPAELLADPHSLFYSLATAMAGEGNHAAGMNHKLLVPSVHSE
ncbi:ATP-binding cassette sub-family C member 9-like [Babylonia areolata]|uniref:ATP-binding cassette sub-family C member 9-like n=1 Tax=Babylonia areolata TaxID=304850 RepID=UPI003FD5BC50